MRVNAAIVTYKNSKVMLQKAVNSVKQEKELIHKFYLVDNSPTNAIGKTFNDVDYIFTGSNLGFGKANNIAIQKSIDEGIDYHLLVNPDISFEKGVIQELVKFMDHNTDVGLVTPKVLYPDGSLQQLCKLIPTPFDLIGRRFLNWGPFKNYIKKRNRMYELQFADYDQQMDVPILSGSFMLIRTSMLQQVGFFDERYFMYLEDFDLCRRIGEISRTVYNPKVYVTHEYKKGSYFNYRLLAYHMVSALKYFFKWGWIYDKKRILKNKACLEDLGFNEDK